MFTEFKNEENNVFYVFITELIHEQNRGETSVADTLTKLEHSHPRRVLALTFVKTMLVQGIVLEQAKFPARTTEAVMLEK